jgi:hypothetical protein
MGDVHNLPKDSEIHVEQLEKLPALLHDLQEYVERYCVGQMTAIGEHLSGQDIAMTDVDQKLRSQATPFGGFYTAYGVAAKAESAHDSVRTSLRELAKALGKMVEPTRKIAENYRTTEEQNNASMDDIKKLLDAGKYTAIDQPSMDGRNAVDPTKAWTPPPAQGKALKK